MEENKKPMIPWSVAMIFMSTSLGVSYNEYIPYLIFNWLVVLSMLILAFTIKRTRFGNPRGIKESKEIDMP